MSGSIGGSRIPTKKVKPTVDKYIENVLKGFNGYKSCDTTGSYNVIMKLGQEKKEGHGDIDLVVHIENNDLKKCKQDFKKYLESLPDDLTPPFVFGNNKGKKAQLYGAIVTCGFPIDGEEDKYVQIDNIIVSDEESKQYQKTFLDLNAQKQALIQGLVRVILNHEDKDTIWKHFNFEGFPEPDKNQEYEFVVSPTALSLRLITLTPERKEDSKKRIELWRSNNWKDIEWLLRDYDVNGTAEECLEKIEKRITDQRSRDRIVGVVNSMIRVGPGEVGTLKGDAKQSFIDLCKKILKANIKENLKEYTSFRMNPISQYISEKLLINKNIKIQFNPDELNGDEELLYSSSDYEDEDDNSIAWEDCDNEISSIDKKFDYFLMTRFNSLSESKDLEKDLYAYAPCHENGDLHDLINDDAITKSQGLDIRLKGGHIELDAINSGSRATYYIYALSHEAYDEISAWYEGGEEEVPSLDFLFKPESILEIKL